MNRSLSGICGTLLVTLCVGCGASADADEWVDSETAEIGEAGCATGTNDDTESTLPPPFESPLTYSNPTCYKAWVVRLNNYVSAPNRRFRVAYNSSLPTDQATCEAAWVRGDMYKLNGGSFQFVEKVSETGLWTGSNCILHGTFQEASTGTYSFALTARKSTASSAATRRVSLGTVFVL
jgi:hypothetical protein